MIEILEQRRKEFCIKTISVCVYQKLIPVCLGVPSNEPTAV